VEQNMAKKIILGFPSPLVPLTVTAQLEKGQGATYRLTGYHTVGWSFVFHSPIALKTQDLVWIDTRNGIVEIVERGGIVIYRRAWLN
jgi:hypothetical protein